MLCRSNSIRRSGSVPVSLNVYDLTPINGYAYWLGLGVYHSGVQVHGVEYAFGSHEHPTTGIFEGKPKICDGFTFRKSILIGWTELSTTEVRRAMEEFAEEYKGNAYNLVTKNCNHFCKDACIRLTGKSIPSWVNRLARIGSFCDCIIPVRLNTTKVGDYKTEDKICNEEKLESGSNRYDSSSSNSSSSSSPHVTRTRGSSSGRRSLHPSSPLIMDSSSSSSYEIELFPIDHCI